MSPPRIEVRSASRGSALLAVILFTTVLLILVGSLLRWSLTERRMNLRAAALMEARNASESLAEYGFSQIRQKFETRSTFSLNPTGSDALKLPPSAFWTGSNVRRNAGDIELVGGTIQNIPAGGNLYFVDPNDPNNEFDPLRGKWVFRRDVVVLSKATVIPPTAGGPPIVSYSMEKISVRGAPLFAHAIFYNMDMEIFPGPTMNIWGPVHVNGNIFCSSQGNQLNFRGPVTLTKDIFHAWRNTIGSTHGTGNETLGNYPVYLVDRSGQLVNMKDSSGIWRDSTMGTSSSGNLTPSANFRAYASQTWQGNLQTEAHGIQEYKPVAIGSYQEDTTPGNGVDNSVNNGRQIIEESKWPQASDADYANKMEVEKQKYSNNAGIYIRIAPSSNLATAPTLAATTVQNGVTVTAVTARSKSDPTKAKTLTLPTGLVTLSGYSKNSSNGNVSSGLYDQRRSKGVALVDLDMTKLKAAVTEMTKPAASRDSSKAIGGLETDDWTGIVYVEVVGAATVDATTGVPTNIPANLTSVRLKNGGITMPSYGTENPGLTVATNAPVYIQGNFNADGNVSTSGGVNPANNPETGEVPCAIAADAITILSSGFNPANSYNSSSPTASGLVEISAAFLTGFTPTNKSGNGLSSGGVHNFPRFLENWSGKDVWIRGSLVCLFESRVAYEPWKGTGYYSPPNRNWGFNDLFRNGVYPPGTPKVLSYRRVDYTELNAERYQTLRASFNWGS